MVLLAGVPDDSEVEIVTKMDEKTGEVLETKKVKKALEAKRLDLVEAKEDDLRGEDDWRYEPEEVDDARSRTGT